MIRIHKPSRPPARLDEQGRALRDEVYRMIDGKIVLPRFAAKVYGSTEVKDALKEAQHGKCCFCESKIEHVAFGDVEHFRPKAAVRQSASEAESKPGYYWLAYEWSNLYLACEQCNRRHKSNLFPLENPGDRVRSHHEAHELERERPLFVDPGRDEPGRFIEFRRFFAAPVDGSPRGSHTIGEAGLDLNRKALRERRRERFTLLHGVRIWLARLCPETERSVIEPMVALILASIRDDAEYAAMSRALVRQAIPWRELSPAISPAELLDRLEDDAVAGRRLLIPPL